MMHERLAILVQRTHPKSGKKRWALVARKKHKGQRRVLKWFHGKPSPERVQQEEARVQYFKRHGGAETQVEQPMRTRYFLSPDSVATMEPTQEKVAVSYGRSHPHTQATFRRLWDLHNEGRVDPYFVGVIKDVKKFLNDKGFITPRQLQYLKNIARKSATEPAGKHPRPVDPQRPGTPPPPPPDTPPPPPPDDMGPGDDEEPPPPLDDEPPEEVEEPPADKDPINVAYELGRRAHGVVAHPIPLHDAELREHLHQHTKSDQSHPLFNKIMEAWTNGWQAKQNEGPSKGGRPAPDDPPPPPPRDWRDESQDEPPPVDRRPGEDDEDYRQRKQSEEITAQMFRVLQKHNPTLTGPEQLTFGDKVKLQVLLAHQLPLLRAHHAKGTLTDELLTRQLGLDTVELESAPKAPPPPPSTPPPPKTPPPPPPKAKRDDSDEDDSDDEDDDGSPGVDESPDDSDDSDEDDFSSKGKDEDLPPLDDLTDFGEEPEEKPGKGKGKPGKKKPAAEDDELPPLDDLTDFGEKPEKGKKGKEKPGKKGKPEDDELPPLDDLTDFGEKKKKKDKREPDEPEVKTKPKTEAPPAANLSKWVRVIRVSDGKVIQVRRGKHTDETRYKPLQGADEPKEPPRTVEDEPEEKPLRKLHRDKPGKKPSKPEKKLHTTTWAKPIKTDKGKAKPEKKAKPAVPPKKPSKPEKKAKKPSKPEKKAKKPSKPAKRRK